MKTLIRPNRVTPGGEVSMQFDLIFVPYACSDQFTVPHPYRGTDVKEYISTGRLSTLLERFATICENDIFEAAFNYAQKMIEYRFGKTVADGICADLRQTPDPEDLGYIFTQHFYDRPSGRYVYTRGFRHTLTSHKSVPYVTFQVMPANTTKWTSEAIRPKLTPQEFLSLIPRV